MRKLVLASLLLVPATVWADSVVNKQIVCDSPTVCAPGLTDYELSALQSAAITQAVSTSNQFNSFFVKDYDLGLYNSSAGDLGHDISGYGQGLNGTVFVSWIKDGNGNVIEQTPLSGSLVLADGGLPAPAPQTPTPEPALLMLFGIGLIFIGRKLGRKFSQF